MNGPEREDLKVVINDIKWIIEVLNEMKDNIKDTNDIAKNNAENIRKNTTFRRIGTWFGSIIGLLLIGACLKILFTGSV